MLMIEHSERGATMMVSRLWRTVVADLPHQSTVMRQWYRAIEEWRTVLRVRLIAGQEASRSVFAPAVEAMRTAGMEITETTSVGEVDLVHGRFPGFEVSLMWKFGVFFLILDSGPDPAPDTSRSVADQFVPYLEDETSRSAGSQQGVRDSEFVSRAIEAQSRQYQDRDANAWEHERSLQEELRVQLDGLERRFREADICRELLRGWLAAPGGILITMGIVSVIWPIVPAFATICILYGLLVTLACRSFPGNGLLLRWSKRIILSLAILVLIFGVAAWIWRTQELLAYGCIALGVILVLGSIWQNRNITRALRNGVSRDDLLNSWASLMSDTKVSCRMRFR
ncbi:hypothetical protein ACFYXQ_08810 [Nocardia jiangxiensis]|uniref:Uncharacterized protein n=1 Tax=Nocardia jiangxiensis TaxID=282685 RepID=A0ABW6RWJ8_9NOCA